MSALDVLNDAHRVGNMRDMREAMKTEDAGAPDMIASLVERENYEKAQCVVKVLNAFNMAKLKLSGTCEWTIDDLRAFSVAVRALGTSWDIGVQAQTAMEQQGRRRQQ
jgi:hypothetical protein